MSWAGSWDGVSVGRPGGAGVGGGVGRMEGGVGRWGVGEGAAVGGCDTPPSCDGIRTSGMWSPVA